MFKKLISLVKKKNKNVNKVKMKLINVKKKTNINYNLYVGQFVNIGVNDSENFYIDIFLNGNYITISKKISNKYYELCEKYSYGLIYAINDDSYDIAIICENGYLKSYYINLNGKYNNGESFIIEDNKLIDKNKVVGEILNLNEKVLLNSLIDNKLICFIKK